MTTPRAMEELTGADRPPLVRMTGDSRSLRNASGEKEEVTPSSPGRHSPPLPSTARQGPATCLCMSS